MPALIGVLLDFSKSMKEIFYDKFDKNDGKQSASILKVVEELMTKANVSSENKIFVIGFGTRYGIQTIDIIGTVLQFQERYANSKCKFEYSDNFENILQILENNGASSIRNWILENDIKREIHYSLLALILDALQTSNEFREKVISFLSPLCRTNTFWENVTRLLENYMAKDKEINTMIKVVQQYFLEDKILIKRFIKEDAVAFDIKFAADAIRNWFEGNAIDDDQIGKVLQTIEIFSSGENKNFLALEKSVEMFKKPEYADFKKYLFVLSDGALSYSGDIETTALPLKRENVKVISCYVSNSVSIHQKRLYSKEEIGWEYGARFMFKLSSTIETGIIPDIILEESGWSIDNSTQDTKLFVPLHHPYQIYETYDAVIVLLLCLDGLGSTSVFKCKHDVDIYHNPTGQEKSPCYVNVVATVFYLAMKKNLNWRDAGPDFYELHKEISIEFGSDSTDVSKILQKLCPKYHLRYQKVEPKRAIVAITSDRLIIARFALTNYEWSTFAIFFKSHPKGILTKNELDVTRRQLIETKIAHCVILTGFNSTYLKLMNTWGCQWADNGFFRVQNAHVLQFEFYDVFSAIMIKQTRK